MAESSTTAQQRWELENDIQAADAGDDAYYKYDHAGQQALQAQKPWTKDPHYFKQVRISALALLKMAMHARSGGNLEIMGMLQGHVKDDMFVVVDAFALPVEGTETRVNAQAEAYEYMVDFAETNKAVGRQENMVGWYHSHPGYGCWLSGIDVGTQSIQQQYQEPFLAIVVDPHRTIAAGKVEIGAFRTYPEHYKPPDEGPSEYQTIPLSKIEDFGVHCSRYYALDISYFKSSLDAGLLNLLWAKYWVNTLASSPLLATRDLTAGQIRDIAEKLEAAEGQMGAGARVGRYAGGPGGSGGGGSAKSGNTAEQQLNKICCDARKVALEQVKGISGQIVKDLLFNRGILPRPERTPAATEVAPMES